MFFFRFLCSKSNIPVALMAGLLVLTFSGCSSVYVTPGYSVTGASVNDIKGGKSLLLVSPKVNVQEFKASFNRGFGNGDSLSRFLSSMIMDSLNHGVPGVSMSVCAEKYSGVLDFTGVDPNSMNNVDSLFKSTDARFIVNVKNIVIGNSVQTSAPTMSAPVYTPAGPVGGGMMVGGGSSESCVVSYDVEIWDSATMSKRFSFNAMGKSQVFLFAYETALRLAIANSVDHFLGYVKSGQTQFF